MQVAHKNKARLEHLQMQDRDEIDDDDFNMKDVVVPDLGLKDHAISEYYKEEVSECYIAIMNLD